MPNDVVVLNSKFKKICSHEANFCADIALSQVHGIQ